MQKKMYMQTNKDGYIADIIENPHGEYLEVSVELPLPLGCLGGWFRWSGGEVVFDKDKHDEINGVTIRDEALAVLGVGETGQVEQAGRIRTAIDALTTYAPDEVAIANKEAFAPWSGDGVPYEKGMRRAHGDKLYRCRQSHTSEPQHTPDLIPALWEVINVGHAGTMADPIPAALNMEYFKDKYYSENGELYRCTRNSEIPLAYMPSQLVGHYFEEVQV